MAESAPTTLVQNVQDDIADFQKLLFLKAMAQYVPRDYHTAVTLMPQRKLPNDEYKNWRRYLDKLSYICDFDSGGRTVTGLLAQTTAQHTIFRLATNCSHDPTRVRMLEHLTFVLRELEDSNKTSDEHAAEICRRSITLSRDKIKDYSCRLGREMKRLKTERSLVATSSERELVKYVKRWINEAEKDPHRLCTTAQEMVVGEHYRTLMRLCLQHGGRYRNVKHYLDRLCSWHGASRYIAKHWRDFAGQISSATVKLLPVDLFHDCQSIHIQSDLDQALLWILGNQKQQFLTAVKGRLAFATPFFKKYGGKSNGTIIHAEAALAQFAYVRNIAFVFGDRYIGCSKPSCCACSMYLAEHPGDFVQRPSHGNAWFKWSPPRLIERPEDRMTSGVMGRMVAIMQADLNATLLGNDLGKRQPFESTSGIGTTIRRRHEVLLQTQQG